MSESITWAEWLRENIARAKFPFDIQSSPEAIKGQATGYHEVADWKVPLIGGFTELENWLMSVCIVELQKASTLFALQKATLMDRCLKDLSISKERLLEAQSDLMAVMAGGIPESYEVLQWCVAHADDITDLVSSDYLTAERVTQIERCGVIMATRVDPDVDWMAIILNSPKNMVGKLTELIQIESGLFNLVEDTEEEVPEKKSSD